MEEAKMKKMIPLLLALILAALAVFYFLKKKDNTIVSPPSPSQDEEEGQDLYLNLYDINSIIDNLSLSSSLKLKAKSWAKHIDKECKAGSGGWSKASVEASAKERGITYAQQIVLHALYQMYSNSQVIEYAQYKIYESEVEMLSE